MPSHRAVHHHQRERRETIRFIDSFMYVIAIIMPLTTMGQIWQIWSTKSAQDVSIFTWAAYTVSATCWLIYAIAHKEKILAINSILWVIVELAVLIGAIIYG